MDIQEKNSTSEEKNKPPRFKEQWQNFSEETTIHGLQNFNRSYSYGAKLIWLVVILGMTTGYVFTVSKSIEAFFRYETRTTSQKVWNETLLYPTVTFCSINYFSKSLLTQRYPSLAKMFIPQPQNPVSETSVNDTSDETTHEPFTVVNSTEPPGIDSSILNTSFYNILKDSFTPIKDTFYDCKWGGSKVNCSDYISTKLTETSLCYYFPSDEIRRIRPTEFLVMQAGPQLGMSVTIDIHQDDYILAMPSHFYAYGMKAIIHDPEKPAVADLEGLDLRPGMQHNIGIIREETTRLTRPYGKSKCISQEKYSYKNCLAECLNDVRYKKCDCVLISNDTDACKISQFVTCLDYKAESHFSGKCRCLPSCNDVLYHTKMSSLAFPSNIGYHRMRYSYKINKTIDYVKNNMLSVNIFYNYMDYLYTVQKPAITSDQLIGDIGGQLGLFLGASFITIAEFIGFLVNFCHSCSKKISVT